MECWINGILEISKLKLQISTDPPAGGELMNTFENILL